MAPIRLAILGSGIFAREAHLPALKALADRFEVVAIYSRNAANAAALAASVPHPVDSYSDIAPVLARDDVDAVDIILPIAVQPAIVEAALKAGKHVISEKPVAPDVASGKALLQTAARLTQASRLVWMVAENFRYEAAFQRAGQIVRQGEIGRPVQFWWNTYVALTPQNKYYQTAWRRDNSFPGGFLLDGGVHEIAAMRAMMGEVESVAAFVTQVRDDLPPADTLSAALRFDSGVFGIYTKTFVAEGPWESFAHVIGDRGALRVNTGRLELTTGGETTTQTFAIDNVQAELADFARAIEMGKVLQGTPEEALQDVAVLEAMFDSAREGRAVEPARIVAPKP
jgi:predicted dehydrogenase